jgi:hypothetical protein
MGTKTRSIALMVVALLVGVAALALAAEEAAPAPAASSQAAKPEASCAKAVECDPTLELGVTENAKGSVYLYDERRPEVWATIGTMHGLRPAAVVAFVRNGEVVAQGCVTEARTADCVIAPAPGTPAGQILLGDDVRVVVNGPREAMDAVIHREHSDRTLGAVAVFAILFGNIWAARF